MQIKNELLDKLTAEDIKELLANLESTLGYAKGNYDKLIRDIHGGSISAKDVEFDLETEKEIIELTNQSIDIINTYLIDLEVTSMINR